MVVLFVERSRTSPDLYHRHPREGNPERSGAPEIQQESPERVVEPDHDEPVGSEDPAEVLKPSERVGGVVQDPVGEDIVEHLGAEATLEQVHLGEVGVGLPSSANFTNTVRMVWARS